jgi:hypothetical protein
MYLVLHVEDDALERARHSRPHDALRRGRYSRANRAHRSRERIRLLSRWGTKRSSCAALHIVSAYTLDWYSSTKSTDLVSKVLDEALALIRGILVITRKGAASIGRRACRRSVGEDRRRRQEERGDQYPMVLVRAAR